MVNQSVKLTVSDRVMENAPLVVTLLLLVDSLHYVFGRLLGRYLPPAVAGFYMLGVATLEVGLFMWWRGMLRRDILWQHFAFFAAVGFLVAGATVFSFWAVLYVDAGTASLLSRSSIVFTLLLGLFWLKERLRWVQWLGAAVALSGVVVIGFQPGDFLRLGSLLIVISAFMYALHVAVVKRYGDNIEFANFFFYRILLTSAFLLLFALGQRQLVWPNGSAWLVILVGGLVDVIISRVLYYLALRRLTLSMHSIILMLSPVVTIGWGLLLFAERPSVQALIGGAVVITGILIANSRREKR